MTAATSAAAGSPAPTSGWAGWSAPTPSARFAPATPIPPSTTSAPAPPTSAGWSASSTTPPSPPGYAYGPVAATGSNVTVGGLIGSAVGFSAAINSSYCNLAASGQTACVGDRSSIPDDAPGLTAAELQAPTGYTGIYLEWNLDLDGDKLPDYPWNFGGGGDYPTFNTAAQSAAAVPAPADYDANDNNLIDLSSIAQLYALRWDPDGDGDPTAADAGAYGTAFPGRTATATGRMGCPDACRGYELTGPLTFPAETSSDYNPWRPHRGMVRPAGGPGPHPDRSADFHHPGRHWDVHRRHRAVRHHHPQRRGPRPGAD